MTHTVSVRESHNGYTGSHYCSLLSDVCPEAEDIVEYQEWFASLPAVMSATLRAEAEERIEQGLISVRCKLGLKKKFSIGCSLRGTS